VVYVIGKECIDVQDHSCVDVCPVDCIYEGDRKNYINPDECIDCGACEIVCPEIAIFPARKARSDDERQRFTADNAAFFTLPLPGLEAPLGNPGGARTVGHVPADTPLAADWPRKP
jgi:NAD-dependent dihydropyrimidine dehydrogenase PreA subunit